ncbi:hypothetical protein V3481_014439 [Fusarium oxysporum f. sp. vasinfectum]
MDELLIDRPAVGTTPTWEAISPPEISQDDEHSVHRRSTSSVGLCHGGASVESYLPPRYMTYVFFLSAFPFYLHDWSSKRAEYRSFLPLASSGVLSPGYCLAALDFGVLVQERKSGCCVGEHSHTIGPGLHELSDLGVLGEMK